MKKATNLVELFQNLVPGKFLSPDTDSQFYVSVYEETLNNLRFNIQTYQNKEHKFY